MKEIVGKKTFTVQCMIFILVIFIILTCCIKSSLAVDTIYYRYTNPGTANTTGDCYLEIYITGAKITGRLVDTRAGKEIMPMNTNITFNGSVTGKWEAGKWLGEGDQNNGRIVGAWTGRNPQHNKDMDRLETYATSGRIEIFMSSSVGSGTLRVLMGADVYEYNFKMQGRVSTVMPAVTSPASTANPQASISGGTLQLPPPVTEAPKIDSKASFSNTSGQVEISRDGGKTWQFVRPNTVIYVDDHIRTGEDSKCVIGLADLSTFVLKDESEVVISSPPEKDSKLALVFGNIWVNVKKMAKDGSMEINMSQAVCGIKGTIFEASHDRKTGVERVSVTQGKVEVRHKLTGKIVLIGPGQAVRIINEGVFLEGVGAAPQISTPPVAQTQSKCIVTYGANGKYTQKSFETGRRISCDNDTFGDPAYGIVKKCYIGSEAKASENEFFIVPDTCHAGNLPAAQTGRAYTSQILTLPQTSTGVGSTPGGTVRGLEETLINELGANINTNLVFYNGNKAGVVNNGRSPTFTSRQSRYIHFIMNYHYNGGAGASPGTISFRDSSGRTYGPWQAGGAYRNKYWIVQPGITLPAGRYTIIDSDPATWSCNAGSGMYGQSLIKGRQWPLVR